MDILLAEITAAATIETEIDTATLIFPWTAGDTVTLVARRRLSDEEPAAAAAGAGRALAEDDGEDADSVRADSDSDGGAAAKGGGVRVGGRPVGKPAAWRGGAAVFSEEGVGIDRMDA